MNLSHSSAKAYHVDYYFHTLEEEAVLGIYIWTEIQERHF